MKRQEDWMLISLLKVQSNNTGTINKNSRLWLLQTKTQKSLVSFRGFGHAQVLVLRPHQALCMSSHFLSKVAMHELEDTKMRINEYKPQKDQKTKKNMIVAKIQCTCPYANTQLLYPEMQFSTIGRPATRKSISYIYFPKKKKQIRWNHMNAPTSLIHNHLPGWLFHMQRDRM